jgi:hypothetical protein
VDAEGEYSRYDRSFEARVPRRLGRDESLPVRIAVDVPPGQYEYTLLIRDALGSPGDARSGNYFRRDLLVRDLSGALPVTSDVAVAADSGGTWKPLSPAGQNIGLSPGPAHRTGPDRVAFVYFEAYNLTPGGTYETRIQFAPEEDDGGEAFDLTFSGDVPFEGQPRTGRILRVDLQGTPPGTYLMTVVVTDEDTGRSTLPHTTAIVVTPS